MHCLCVFEDGVKIIIFSDDITVSFSHMTDRMLHVLLCKEILSFLLPFNSVKFMINKFFLSLFFSFF